MLKHVKIDKNVTNFVILRSCEYDLNITKLDMMELLRITTKFTLFEFEGKSLVRTTGRCSYGIAAGSPHIMTNAFMSKIEKQIDRENKLPIFYKRFVNDTLSAMPDPEAASEFLETLNKSHPSIDFTMDLEENGKRPFLGMDVIRNGCSPVPELSFLSAPL